MMKPLTRREFLLTAFVIIVVVTSFTSLQWNQKPGLHWSTSDNQVGTTPWTEQTSRVNTSSPEDIPPGNLRLKLDGANMPQTEVMAHAPGWTVFEKLYLFNGTLYIVSDAPLASFPDRKYMISNGYRVEGGEEGSALRLPSDTDMQVITVLQAAALFGPTFDRLNGVTWLCNDPSQYMTHYYHFVAELLFGFWRAHTGVLANSSESTLSVAPNRLFFGHLRGSEAESQWRDYAQLNQFIVRAIFPALSVEDGQDWDDRAILGVPYVFDQVVLADRSAAMLSPHWQASHRPAANAFELPGAPFGSPDSGAFWAPLRNTLVDLMMARSQPMDMTKSVVTYISRQEWDRRMLRSEDHERLVQELHALRDRTGCEVNIVSMSKLSRVEQILLAARTTVMMGVHGNGLTALLWMQPTKRSTVMEFFAPGGFAHDYEWTARALGMAHYGFWGKESFTFPEVKQVMYTENFHGDDIPLDGALVAKLCEERLDIQ